MWLVIISRILPVKPTKKPALDWPVVSSPNRLAGRQGVVIIFESIYSHQFVKVLVVIGCLKKNPASITTLCDWPVINIYML